MNEKYKYIIRFKDKNISPITFSIKKNEFGRYHMPNKINVKNENYFLNTSRNKPDEIIRWVNQELSKYEHSINPDND